MSLNFIGRPVRDVDAAAIGLPAWDVRRKMLVRVCDAAVVLLLELVLGGAGSGIAPLPKLFDEVLALLVRLEPLECRPFLIGDDVDDILGKPLSIRGRQWRRRPRLLRSEER